MKICIYFLLLFIPLMGVSQDTQDEEEDEETGVTKGSKDFSPFRLWIGTNIDLLDGVKTANLYGNLDFTTPLDTRKNHILLSVGTFQNRSISIDSSGTRQAWSTALLDRNAPPVNNSISIVRSYFTNKPTQTINSLGFYSQIGVRLLSNGEDHIVIGMKNKMKTVNGYGAVRGEIIRRDYITKNNYEVIDRDTVLVPIRDGIRLNSLAPDRTISRYIGVIGFGTPIIIITEQLEVRFNPFVGMALSGDDNWWVGSLSFSITEKLLGLSIGGEARTINKGEVPIMNLFIAKSFTIKDFRELINFN